MEVLNKVLPLILTAIMSMNLSGCRSANDTTDNADATASTTTEAAAETDTTDDPFADVYYPLPDNITMDDLLNGIQINGKVAEAEKMFVSLQLQFFDMVMFGSEEKQPKLIAMLREVAKKIDTTSGRGWFCIYAGYRYYKQQLAVKGGYTDFFADIEALVPDLLTKIDTSKEGEARYHNYTQLLGREADAWYMDSKKLPPLNEITVWKDKFNGDKNRFSANAQNIIDVYKQLKKI